MPIELPPLPYERDALAPHISAETLDLHHGKHHRSYVDKTNKLIEGTAFESKSIEQIIRVTAGNNRKLFNQAAQAWNHSFYWSSMTPGGGGAPQGEIAEKVNEDFGSYDAFKTAFTSAARGRFGSGWAWLVLDGGKLAVKATPNAANPLIEPDVTPLLTLDVWEHAYYLDHQNRRADYIAAFLDHLINWDFAEANLREALVAEAA